MTPEQQAIIDRGGPRCWAVITSDGFTYVTVDKPLAERYAANTHGIVVPMVPEKP